MDASEGLSMASRITATRATSSLALTRAWSGVSRLPNSVVRGLAAVSLIASRPSFVIPEGLSRMESTWSR